MRQIAEFTARVMPFSGSGDSAASMVTISVPMKENIVTSMAEMIAVYPFGSPPSAPMPGANTPRRPGVGVGGGPLAEHAHRQHHKCPGKRVRDDDCRPGLLDRIC